MFAWLFSHTTFTLFTFSITIAYFYIKFVYSYWRCRGVPQLQPSFPFGNFGRFSFQQLSICEQVSEMYHRTTEPFIGVYLFLRPILIVRDATLIHNILCKDFHHFIDRGVFIDEINDPLSAHLFALTGRQWKNVRTKLFAPTFTTAKMRHIFLTLLNCKNPLQKFVKKMAKANETIDIGEMTSAFTTNAIASIAFGIDVPFSDPENPLRTHGRKVFAYSLKNTFRLLCFSLYPKLLQWTGIRSIDGDVQAFFHDMVRQMLDLRRKHDIERNDFFDLLIQMHETGTVQLNDEWQTVIENDCSDALSIEQIAAQSLLFFMSYEMIAATMSFCLCEIARDPAIQQRLCDEIDSVLAQQHRQQQKQQQKQQQNENSGSGGGDSNQFTYESIAELKYLDSCIDESLRKYPVAPILTRQCTKDYKIPGSDVTLKKGEKILIPTFSLQRDEKYYQDAMKFDPNRFFSSSTSSNNNSSEIQNPNEKMACDRPPYLPFGDGLSQRACIGRRLAKMLIKVGIAAILQKCSIELGDQHAEHEFQFITPIGAFLRPKTGIQLRFKARKVLVSSQRIDFLDMIDQFSPGESEFSRAVRAAQPMRPIPKAQRPTLAAHRKRMSLR